MPADFHFLRPEWLLLIPAVVAVAVLMAKRQLGAGHWRDVVDPALMPYVLSRTPGRGIDYRWWLLGVTGIVAAVARVSCRAGDRGCTRPVTVDGCPGH